MMEVHVNAIPGRVESMNENLETTGSEAASLHRVYWRSRRGMLELELLLLPFARNGFSKLSRDEQTAYNRLLENEDWDIFDWLQGRDTPADPVLQGIVKCIQAFNADHAGT